MPHHNETLDKLSQVLKHVSEVRNTDAAVALLLKPICRDLAILLVERAKSLKDPWSGQMAFPGGKHDQKDQSMLQTAVRETFEETNINLTQECRILGALENTRSGAEPNLMVAPFVFLIEDEPAIKLSKELVGHMWIPLSKLPTCKRTARLPFGEVPAYTVEGRAVWGLTYRILEQLFKALGS